MNKYFRVNLILIFIVPADLDVKMKAVSLAALFLIVSFTLNTILSYCSFLGIYGVCYCA
jgi:hypothetical protein